MRVNVMDGNKKQCVGGYSLEEASQRGRPYTTARLPTRPLATCKV